VNKFKLLKGVCLVAATSMIPISQAAIAEATLTGWVNEGVTFYDDGVSSDAVQISDGGNTLGTRMIFAASTEAATGLTVGMEIALEPQNSGTILGWGTLGVADDNQFHSIGVLNNNVWVSGAWGKITFGLQSMPTDNIAVLEDPSLTLWSGISPVFRGGGVAITGTGAGVATGAINGGAGALWGNFLNCFTEPVLRGNIGIGIDCNGATRSGVRYDLPAFGPVSIAIGYANDDVYDITGKWKGNLGRMKASVALGYAINQGVNNFGNGGAGLAGILAGFTAAAGAAGATCLSHGGTANSCALAAAAGSSAADAILYNEAENFQMQAGLMDPETGLFGSIAYQNEDADLIAGAAALAIPTGGVVSDDSDAWWLKVGIKKQWFSMGDTSLSFDYGQYSDQYGLSQASAGVTGSEVERIGVAVDQYFGSSLIIYGKWEQLDLDVDCSALNLAFCNAAYGGANELDTFTLIYLLEAS